MPPKKDLFDQFMWMQTTMSAANALTFGEVTLGMSIFEYAALIITRIEYKLSRPSFAELVVNADQVSMAVTGSDSIADLELNRPEVYDAAHYAVAVSGTPATAQLMPLPIVHDFTTMSGGGLLVPAQNVFFGIDSVGAAGALTALARVYYHVKALSATDFIELVQRLRVLST